MLDKCFALIDWFIPEAAKSERSELGLARNFVFTHLCGPLLAQSISLFLYLTDPHPGFACWTVIVSIWSFWLLPFMLKFTKNLQMTALVSCETLAFAALFGSFHYGGVSSPFLPWLIVALLLGFFYLSDKPLLVIGMFAGNLLVFMAAYFAVGSFPQHVPVSALSTVGWISISSATIYMCWMAIYYASMMLMRSELQKEAERHRLTAVRLRQAMDMAEKANRQKSIFLAKMSHELRTPLNAVIGYSQMLLEDAQVEGDENSAVDLEKIHSAGHHLLRLVNEVLDLSKIEAGKMELSVEDVDAVALFRDVAEGFRDAAAKTGNSLVIQLDPDLGAIRCDAKKVQQAVSQVLDNATKFTDNGLITVTAERRSAEPVDQILFKVKDTGIGIAPEVIPDLFENFSVADDSSASKYGGTGLGLALSLKLCQLMGGAISVESQLGEGSCFTITLPVVPPAPAEAAPEAEAELEAGAAVEGAGSAGVSAAA